MKKAFLMVALLSVIMVSFSPFSLTTQALAVAPNWVNMAVGNCNLTQLGSGFVEIEGDTICFSSCDVVRVTLHLQQFKNGDWQTIHTDEFTNYNTDYVCGFRDYFVETGYNYRTVADHYVKNGSLVETAQSYTLDLYID